MNKPKLNESCAGVRVYYSHADKGHWIEWSDGSKRFVKERKKALELFHIAVRDAYRRGLRVV